jgi:Sec-independent protein secretion pathway component TatC
VPLYLLFEVSLLIATIAERRERRREAATPEGAPA